MNKSAMMQSEKAGWTVTRNDRPMSPGGRTLSKDGNGGKWHKPKERALASTAMKAADKRRRDAYNASRK
jgi:hypothetical protein